MYFVLITASVAPSLQQISICFNTKSHLFKNTVQKCNKNDNQCMVEQLYKVCGF